jgi:hypothetical protein
MAGWRNLFGNFGSGRRSKCSDMIAIGFNPENKSDLKRRATCRRKKSQLYLPIKMTPSKRPSK